MGVFSIFRSRLFIILVLSQLICGTSYSAPLLIAVEDDAGPWSQRDGLGFANDIVRSAFKAAGVDVELSVVPYVRCKDMAIKGKVAACFSMSWLPEFTGKIVLADKPLFNCYADYFTDTKKPLKATKESNIPRGTVVGIVSGYEYPPSVYALQKKGIIVFEESESEEMNLKKVALGRIDTALVNYNKTKPAELLLAKAAVTDKVKRSFRSGTLGSFIGFSTRHPQGMEALEKFNKGYRIVSSNGTRDKLERKWRNSALKDIASLTDKVTPR